MKSVRSFPSARRQIRLASVLTIADVPARLCQTRSDGVLSTLCRTWTLLQEWQCRLAAHPSLPQSSGSGLWWSIMFGVRHSRTALTSRWATVRRADTVHHDADRQTGRGNAGSRTQFVMYRHNAALYGMDYVGVPLNGISPQPACRPRSRQEHRPVLTFIAYSNNPTGCMFLRACRSCSFVQLRLADGIVVVDRSLRRISTATASCRRRAAFSTSSSCVPSARNRFLWTAYRLCGGLSGSHRRTAKKSCRPTIMNQLSLTTAAKLRSATLRHSSLQHRQPETNANGCSPN